MSEFRIETELDLDTSKAERKLSNLKGKAEKPLSTEVDLKVNYKDGKGNDKNSLERKAKEDAKAGLGRYKRYVREVNKIQNELNKGSLKGEQRNRAYARMHELADKANEIRETLKNTEALQLFDEGQATKDLKAFNKIQQGLNRILDKSKKIDKNILGSAFDDIYKESERIRQFTDGASMSGIPLDGSVKAVKNLSNFLDKTLGDQNKYNGIIKSLEKAKDLANGLKISDDSKDNYFKQIEKYKKGALADLQKGNPLDKYSNGAKQLTKELRSAGKATTNLNGLLKTSDKIKGLSDDIFGKDFKRNLESELSDIQDNIRKKAESGLSFSDDLKRHKELANRVSGYGKGEKEFNRINSSIEKLNNKTISLDVDVVGEEQIEKLQNELNSIRENTKLNIKAELPVTDQLNQLDSYKTKISNIDKLSSIQRSFDDIVRHGDKKMSFDGVTKSFNEAYESISKISSISGQAGVSRNLDNVTNSLGRFELRMSEVGNKRKLFGGVLSDLNHGLRQISLGDFIGDAIYDGVYGLARGYSELDASMTNLKKVADPVDVNSIRKLDTIRSKAVQISKDVGQSTADVQNAIASSLQAGIGSMKESIAVARDSMILANVGDMSQEDASKAMNSIIAGFNIDPLKMKTVGNEMGGVTRKTTELANAMDILNYAG